MKRIDELDGLRGLAALLVVAFHLIHLYDVRFGHSHSPWEVFRLGWLGVPLFFMISGFVIFMTLDNCRRPLDFAVSRFARLFPAYWIGIFLTTIVVFVLGPEEAMRSPFEILCNLTMLQGLLPGVRDVDGVYWSLTVELVFYFGMLGLFTLGLLKRIEPVCLVWLIGATSYWTVVRFTGVRIWSLETLLILQHCGPFVAGICLFLIHAKRQSRFTYWLLPLSLMVNLLSVYSKLETLVIASFYMVFFVVVRTGAPVLRFRVLLFFGAISYPLYLVHQNIGYATINALYAAGIGMVESLLLTFVGVVALATAICFGVEQPSRRAIRAKYQALVKAKHTTDQLSSQDGTEKAMVPVSPSVWPGERSEEPAG